MKNIALFLVLTLSQISLAQKVKLDDLTSTFKSDHSIDSLFGIYYAQQSPVDWGNFVAASDLLFDDKHLHREFLSISADLLSIRSPQEALALFDLVIENSKELNDSVFVARLNSQKSFTLGYAGKYQDAIQILFEALKMVNPERHPDVYAEVLASIGHAYGQVGNIETVLKYLRQSLSVYNEINHEDGVISTLFGIGGAFLETNSFDSAEYYFVQVLSKIEDRESKVVGNAYGNLAQIYAFRGEYRKSITTQFKGLRIEMLHDDEFSMVESNLILGAAYCGLVMMDSANYYFDISRDLIVKHDLKDKLIDLYHAQSLAYPLAGEFALAYDALNSFKNLEDSLKDVQVDQLYLDIKEKYDTEQKEAQNQLLIAENFRQKILFGVAILLLLVALSVVYYIFRLHQKTKSLNHKISAQAFALNKLNKTKDRLFSIIGHDLRGPVTSFNTATSIIKANLKKNNLTKIDEMIEHVDRSSQNLMQLLDNLLSWSLSQQSEISLDIRPQLLKPIVDDAIELYAEAAQIKEVEISSDLRDERVLGDHDTLGTVVRNLISNALKFSPSHSQITITQRKSAGYVELVISDQGIGIPEENFDKLFNIEKSKVRKGTSKESGTGLGLALVKEFVDLNNGQLKLTSKEGEGTTFYVALPEAS